MDLQFSAEERAFQQDVREFLESELTPELKRAVSLTPTVFVEKDIADEWHARLNRRGWLAPLWPKQYGGAEWTPVQQFIYESEAARAGAPTTIPMGVRMVGPVIIRFGSEAQKAHYLPRILSGEDTWCQGYSEPGSGSDLASLKTRAEPEGEDYLVNGTKLWTTHAHYANRIFCLVRTSSEGRPQAGISFLLIDMNSPGISVTPIRSLSGDHEVNQVFFDNVRVPQANRIGDEGQGWTCAKFLLEHERGGVFSHRLMAMVQELRRLMIDTPDGEATLLEDARLRERRAALEVRVLSLEITEMRVLSKLRAGDPPGAESSMLKVEWSELQQALTELAMDIAGPYAQFFEPGRPLYALAGHTLGDERLARIPPDYLNTRAASIFAGTNEIQRNIIARLTLGA